MNKPKHLFITSFITAVGLLLGVLAAIVYIFNLKNSILNAYTKSQSFSESSKSEAGVIIAALKLDKFYTTRDVVECFDALLTKRNNKTLHIAFYGDSLLRNQFTNYIKV